MFTTMLIVINTADWHLGRTLPQVSLLDNTLTELTLGIGVPVLAISGNHDGGGSSIPP
jgi:DNA repair exonuclease SbcCD nuclease subunit